MPDRPDRLVYRPLLDLYDHLMEELRRNPYLDVGGSGPTRAEEDPPSDGEGPPRPPPGPHPGPGDP